MKLESSKKVNVKGKVFGGDRYLHCISIQPREKSKLVNDVYKALAYHPDAIEWRLDYFDPMRAVASLSSSATDVAVARVLDALAAVAEPLADTPLIVSFRRPEEGGEAKTCSEALLADVLKACVSTGRVDMVDVAMDEAAWFLRELLESFAGTNTKLILSHHDFCGMPDTDSIISKGAEAQAKGADVAKVFSMAKDAEGVIALSRAATRAKSSGRVSIPFCVAAMGDVGCVTRVLGDCIGSDCGYSVLEGEGVEELVDRSEDYIALREVFAPLESPKPESRAKVEVKGRVIGGRRFLAAVPIRSGDRITLIQDVREALALRPDIIEWRIDFFGPLVGGDFGEAFLIDTLRELSAVLDGTPLLLCMRRFAEGGSFKYYPPAARERVVRTCVTTGLVDLVDMELNGFEEYSSDMRALLARHGTRLILSHHNFFGIYPREKMIEELARCQVSGADIAKLYYTANSAADVVEVARTARDVKQNGLIDIPFCFTVMGDCGLIARVLGGRYGNDYCYFSLTGAKGGQEEDLGYYLALKEGFGTKD